VAAGYQGEEEESTVAFTNKHGNCAGQVKSIRHAQACIYQECTRHGNKFPKPTAQSGIHTNVSENEMELQIDWRH
jgi:hypothetical protein